MTRILLYGVTGSGKTTAAARISAVTGIPWTSVDDLTWQRGWVTVAAEEQRRRITAVCEQDEWVLDTAYSQWLDVPLSRVQLVVALDYPRWFSLQRLVRRSAARVVDKRPICNGNTETLRGLLGRDSVLVWHFRSFATKRRRIGRWAEDPEGPRLLRFGSAAALDAWLAVLGDCQPR